MHKLPATSTQHQLPHTPSPMTPTIWLLASPTVHSPWTSLTQISPLPTALQPPDPSQLHHVSVDSTANHDHCGTVMDLPTGTLEDWLQVKQGHDAIYPDHATRSHLPTLDPGPSTHLSGIPEALIIKPDHDALVQRPCGPTAPSDSAPRSLTRIRTVLVPLALLGTGHTRPPVTGVSRHVRTNTVSTLPRTSPRRQHATSQQTRSLPGFRPSTSQAGFHLQSSEVCGCPQLQRGPTASATQHKHSGLEETEPSLQRSLTH